MVAGPVRSTKTPLHPKVTSDRHYDRRKRGVRLKYYPASETAARIELLVKHGHTYNSISKLAGCSYHTIRRIALGDYETTHPRTYRAVMSVPLSGDPGDDFWVPGFAVERRLRALQRNGWTRQAIADRLGCRDTQITQFGAGGASIRSDTRNAVFELYDEISGVYGGSKITAGRAARRGWPSPLDWESACIDDPDSWPDSDVGEGFDVGAAVDLLSDQGLSAAEIASKLGISDRTVVRYRSLRDDD